jgi:hypothetical protein
VVREPFAPAPTTRVRRPAPTREELMTSLAESNGSVAQVARLLNRQYAVVWRNIQRYGIDAGSYRKEAKDSGGSTPVPSTRKNGSI